MTSFRVDFEKPDACFVFDGDTIRSQTVTVRGGPLLTMLRLN